MMYRAQGEVRLKTPNMTVLTATLTCSALRAREDRTDAGQCVPALLRVLGLSNRSSAEAWRLLHLLLRWVEPMPTPAKRRRMTRLRTPRRRLASPSDRACRPPVRASGGRRYTFAVKRIGG